MKPCQILVIGGAFSFHRLVRTINGWLGHWQRGLTMDTSEAKKNLNKYSDELNRYQNLSRTGLSREEMLVIDSIILRLKNKINNLRSMLNA